MLLRAPRPVEEAPLAAADLPVPDPAPDEVRLRVRACGVCHTDLHTVEGELAAPRLPLVPGHQVIGVVDAVGRDVPPGGPRVGDTAGVPWLHRSCGACAFCARGDENLCLDPRFTGLHVPGGYAEHLCAPAAFVCALPPARAPDGGAAGAAADADAAALAPLLCAGIIGYRALRRAGVAPGETLALWGFGASAHLALQIARHWGCTVHVFTRGAAHRALALRLGAAWAGAAEDPPPAPAHRAVSFAPAGRLVPLALAGLERGGTLALAGIHLDAVPALDYQRHLFQEKTLTSVTAATRADAAALFALAAAVPLRTDVQRFPLAEANAALAALKHGRLAAAAAVLEVAAA